MIVNLLGNYDNHKEFIILFRLPMSYLKKMESGCPLHYVVSRKYQFSDTGAVLDYLVGDGCSVLRPPINVNFNVSLSDHFK